MPSRECLMCQKPLKGRADKKFCNEYCRNTYHGKKPENNLDVIKFYRIKTILDSMSKSDQRLIVWAHLVYLIGQEKNGLGWIMEQVKQLIQEEENRLLNQFQ